MNKLLIIFLLSIAGCNAKINYSSGNAKLPDDKESLEILLAGSEAKLEGLIRELEESKSSRQLIVDASKSADGYFSRNDFARKITSANTSVEWAAGDVTREKENIARIKSKLEIIKNEQSNLQNIQQ